jgi:hypothetical protein
MGNKVNCKDHHEQPCEGWSSSTFAMNGNLRKAAYKPSWKGAKNPPRIDKIRAELVWFL